MESDSSSEGDHAVHISYLLIQLLINPPSPDIIISILLVVLLLICSALISGSEAAFYSFLPKDIEKIRNDSDRASHRITELLKNRDYLLSTILISNNLINVSIVIFSYFIITNLFAFSDVVLFNSVNLSGTVLQFVLNVVIVTSALVLFGELAPKVFAQQYNIGLARFMSGPLLFLRKLFYYPSKFLVLPTRVLEKKLKSGQDDITLEELNKAIDITASDHIVKQDIELLKGIVHFGNTTVKQIMRSRVDMVAVENTIGYHELMRVIRESGYSRIPVYRETTDQIVGVLYVKDLLTHIGKTDAFEWQTLLREPFFVPETKKIDDLLKEIQENRTHLALVVDEYGGTSGLITLEDIVEEVLGEIKDEFDDLIETPFKKIDDHNFIFEGKALINDVCKLINTTADTFDDVKGDSDSLAGLLLQIAGRIPNENDELTYDKYKFRVLSVGNNRIEKIKLIINENVVQG